MNELSPKISVIVPVYKAEAYLHRCVDSLLAQTFQDFEILLIDDGSPDRSGEICDEYAKKDKRIRVFHKENGGVSSARQCGIDNAKGEYTIHADPDDWVESTMLEELYKKAKEDDADMVICDFYNEEKDNTTYVAQTPSSLHHETVLCELFQQVHGSCWNKFIRRICYERFNIKFPLELSYCEDLYVNVCLLSNEINISYLPKAFYHYDQYTNLDSLVHRPCRFIIEQGKCFRMLLSDALPSNLYDKIYPNMLYHQAMNALIDKHPCLSTFRNDFEELKQFIKQIDASWKAKMLLRVAFYISPYLSHAIIIGWSSMHGR